MRVNISNIIYYLEFECKIENVIFLSLLVLWNYLKDYE